jgi:Novel STAND NTPase 1
MAADPNPFVGPRPFQRDEAARFFGRPREVRDVVSLIVAQRVLLLYAVSGAGKTSLLNAGVFPLLEDKEFDVLPVARVRADDPPPDRNVFVHGVLSSLGLEAGSNLGLADSLNERPRPPRTRLRVLVVDQFEELFTEHPGRWQERPSLFDALGAALERDSALRIVLAIREDFVAQLDPFASRLPGGLQTRFRLERLDHAAALAAIKGPLDGTSRWFAPGVAETLVGDLLRFRIEAEGGETEEVEGQFVEPVQLQVVCQSLWSELPPDVHEITEEQVHAFGDVDEVLRRFYDDAVAAAKRGRRLTERRIRRWVEKTLITPGGTRAPAFWEPKETAGMPNEIVRILEEKRLIRAEPRARGRWYELTHDRLLGPIQSSNAAFTQRLRRRGLTAGAILLLALVGSLLSAWGFTFGSGQGAPVNAVILRAACGHYRFGVKTLTDPDAGSINFTPIDTTITALGSLAAPTPARICRVSVRRGTSTPSAGK